MGLMKSYENLGFFCQVLQFLEEYYNFLQQVVNNVLKTY